MPIDTSIYSLLKPVEAPSMLDAQTKAANLSSLSMQQQHLGQQMQQDQKDRATQDYQRQRAAYGQALVGMSGMTPQEREKMWPSVRQELLAQGLPADKVPDFHDEGLYSQKLRAFNQSPEGMAQQLQQSTIEKNKAEAIKDLADARRKGTTADPFTQFTMRKDYETKLDQKKKDEELKRYTNMGGWTLSEGATPTLDDAKKFKAAAGSARALLSNLNEYQNLVNEYGTEIGGKVAQRMDSLVRDIQLAAKNEDLYGLGVLTGPDLALLEEVVGSAPTGLGAKLNPMSWGGSKANNKAEQFREMINTRMNAKAKTIGFEPNGDWRQLALGGKKETKKDGSGTPSAYAGDTPPSDIVLMQGPDGVVRQIPLSQKGEAIAAGGKVVN
jgi:hypothetical protein